MDCDEEVVSEDVLPALEVSDVEFAGGVVLQATNAKQSRTASNPASNLFVNIALFLSLCWISLN